MSSKSSRSLYKRWDTLGLGTSHSRSRAREDLTHIKKERENIGNLMTTSPSNKKRRTMEIRRKILRIGVTSIRDLGITLSIAAQSSH
jgi:hypothetical protein